MPVALQDSAFSIDRYARALRFGFEQQDPSRLEQFPDGELVLLVSSPEGLEKRIVIRMEERTISVSAQASLHCIPQAVVQCPLSHWIEYLRTGSIPDPDCFDVFGDPQVLGDFLRVLQLEQRPVALRCRNMLSSQPTPGRGIAPSQTTQMNASRRMSS